MKKEEDKITMEAQTVIHPFQPFYNQDAKVLILGSFPSVKSREQNFYYGHPQNQFWRLLSDIYDEPLPITQSEKEKFLQIHHLALYDVIYKCSICGSSDQSIQNVVPTNLKPIIENSQISKIYVTGKTALHYYQKYQEPNIHIPASYLPSPSPLYQVMPYTKKLQEYKKIKDIE